MIKKDREAQVFWQTHPFNTLTLDLLYEILRLRERVFVIEQSCIYEDLDNWDQDAEHLLALQGSKKKLIAYCRILAPGVRYAEPAIGRLLVREDARGQGVARALVRRALQHCARRYPGQSIRISAQQHLEAFYSSEGFEVSSEPYDEDGIPHIEMLCTQAATADQQALSTTT